MRILIHHRGPINILRVHHRQCQQNGVRVRVRVRVSSPSDTGGNQPGLRNPIDEIFLAGAIEICNDFFFVVNVKKLGASVTIQICKSNGGCGGSRGVLAARSDFIDIAIRTVTYAYTGV